ncbi:Rv3654c family TadE-like protein [Ornithinimicrobium sp. Y1694]|uniref:Rv3654c family TadE-like protein n=1 Tax=Ornithinimicrobium sp. Y1694 TaxID=3418590 RepID=UPI003CF8D215
MAPERDPEPAPEHDPERGSGTVLAVGLIGVVTVVLVAGLVITAVAVAGQRARTAADLSALAAAGRMVEGHDLAGACAFAAELADRHGAEVTSCDAAPAATGSGAGAAPSVSTPVQVEVTRPVLGTPWTVRVTARAGGVPVDGG